MANSFLKSNKIWIIAALVIAVGGYFGYKYWLSLQDAVPEGIAWGNGRLEAKLADVSSKEALRIKEILVDEGDLVEPGQLLVKLDTVTLDSELAQANANVLAAKERLAISNSAIVRRKAEINLAKIEVERSGKLVEDRAGSQRELDVRKSSLETTTAALAEEEAKLQTAKQEVVVAQSNVATVQTRIDDALLKAPIRGRVLYRLAEPGEVLAAGGKALTLVNLDDVYMEVFLASADAAKTKMGAEGRITVDYQPGIASPAFVTFVSPEAQFTPKQVETRSERDKLMFRVKLQIPKELVAHYIDSIKTGVRGVGYVKVDPNAAWPSWLNDNLLKAGPDGSAQGAPAAPGTTTKVN